MVMMNPIKFRVWTGKAMYPVYSMRWQYRKNELSEVLAITPNKTLKLHPSAGDFVGDEFVLMQCTGVVDKRGREIYDGDILRHDEGALTVVEWDVLGNSWSHKDENFYPYQISGGKMTGSEVVGNRYQNPGLITWNI